MSRSALTGSRIRERRMLGGVKQADLARQVGVSASYLNLIEHNRRRIGDALLRQIAEALGVEAAVLTEGAEAALLDGLRDAAAVAAEGGADGEAPELDRIEEFVGRFPGWARLLSARHGRVALLERTVAALSDRIAHDPVLSSALHEVLSALTGVRSAAAILADTEDLEPEWRLRFQGNLSADADRLALGAEALVAYLDGPAGTETALASPLEEVEGWLAARGHHLPEVETGAATADALIGGAFDTLSARRIAAALVERYAADAQRLPLVPFRAALAAAAGDPAAVAAHFGVDLAAVLRRVASLPEQAGAGLVICDGAGALTFRKPTEGFGLPRFGAGCPLWPLYQALSRPMVPLRATVEMAGRTPRRYRTYAICQQVRPAGFDAPQVLEATMLVLPETGAKTGPAEPVGPTCRICPREACPARREPSILMEEF
ncbi:MAG: helix-turn-helix domain-containing protein [Rhodobacteraceae bacterium]|nr:helix-turn-helix domain-containing protein [Paracoccaceae bacterium]